MSALQPNPFLIHFSIKPCIKVTASSLQSVLIFALYPIVAVCIVPLFFIPLASVHLCHCFKVAVFICLCIGFPFLLSFSHSSVDLSKEEAQSDIRLIHLRYFKTSAALCSAISECLKSFRSKFTTILIRSSE